MFAFLYKEKINSYAVYCYYTQTCILSNITIINMCVFNGYPWEIEVQAISVSLYFLLVSFLLCEANYIFCVTFYLQIYMIRLYLICGQVALISWNRTLRDGENLKHSPTNISRQITRFELARVGNESGF